MDKANKKLKLNVEQLRELTEQETNEVVGGAPCRYTRTCGTTCFGTARDGGVP